MADEFKELPSSPTAALLRRAQEAMRGVGDDPSRSWWLRGPAKVADALIGEAPEGLDDIASGMARLKRPSYQESWMGANQPLVDAAGITPVGGAAKASFLGARMMRQVGKLDEFKDAEDVFLRTGTPPPGWFVHPGADKAGPRLMKYEPQQYDDYALFDLKQALQNDYPLTLDAEDVLGAKSDYLKAYNRSIGPKTGGNRLSIEVDPDKSKTSLGTYKHDQSKVVLRPNLLKQSAKYSGLYTGLKETLGHELSHGAQAVEELPTLLRGANLEMYNFSPRVEKWAKSWGDADKAPYKVQDSGKFSPDIKGQTPNDAAAAILRQRLMHLDSRGFPAKQYLGNPGEAAARGIQRVEVERSQRDVGGTSEALLNKLLRDSMAQANLETVSKHNVSSIDDEMRLLLNQFRARQARLAKKGQP